MDEKQLRRHLWEQSATHERRDSFVYCVNRTMFEVLEPLLVAEFDLSVEDDIKRAENDKKADSFLKKSCLIKILSYPIEGLFLWLFGTPDMREDRFVSTKMYLDFLRNKLTKEDLNRKLNERAIVMARKFRS